MSLVKLKKALHEKSYGLSENAIFIIPEWMKKGIRQGKEDIKNGDYITMEELEKRYQEYLKD